MSRHQRIRRMYTWRGSFLALLICSLWMLLSALGGSVTA